MTTRKPGVGHGHQRDGKQQERERQHHVRQAGDDRVDHATEIPGDQAQHGADGDGEQGGDDSDVEGDPRPVGDPHQDVPAEVVGTQEELPVGGSGQAELVRPVDPVLVIGAVPGDRRDHRGEYGHEDDEHDDHCGGDGGPVLRRRAQASCQVLRPWIPRAASSSGAGTSGSPRPESGWGYSRVGPLGHVVQIRGQPLVMSARARRCAVLRKGGSGPHQVLAVRDREVARGSVVGRITEPGLEHRLLLGAAVLGLGAAGVEAARPTAG